MPHLLVEVGDPLAADATALLEEHLAVKYATSPAESVHALDPVALAHPSITFVVSREHGETIGCGALKELDPRRGELKSVRAAQAGAGAAQAGQYT